MENLNGFFMEPQNFSVNDGEGIRTIIFFTGCPLKCKWCSNPESNLNYNRIAYYENTCIKCGSCSNICPSGVAINLNTAASRLKCTNCGTCLQVCPNASRKTFIHKYTSKELLSFVEKQKLFYRYSKGGVTFSGGEATLQDNILRELTYILYDEGINLAIETSCYFDFNKVHDILKKMNLIFVDIKHMDSKQHKLYTGVENEKILSNISRLNELKVPIIVRIPIIEGVNASSENIIKTAKFVKENISNPQIELLPFHSFGNSKYEALGLKKPSKKFYAPSKEKLKDLYKIIEAEGVKITSYK